ncbi:MAG: glycosyltransferase family 2 protein [Isosphaeraceae bacterium]
MISVVIPTCRRPDLLARCLDRLAPGVQSLPADRYEVIVSDDGEPSVERFLAEKYPWVTWCPGPRRGPAANRNSGARRARGEWLAFTDDDCVPEARWLAEFVAAIHGGCHVYEGRTTCVAGLRSPLEQAPVNDTGGCLWSCNFLIRRCVFDRIAGFDEGFPFPYMEDADLRDRLVNAGYLFEFVPGAVVDHPPRRAASGRRLARYHESWVYHWYKRGYRGLASPRLVRIITEARLGAIRRHRFSYDTLQALGSFANELVGMTVRLPLWEWKYRWRFRSPPSR